MNVIVYACDIGSVIAGSFAWARVAARDASPAASTDIDALITSIQSDAKNGACIALGFEAPLFMPVPLASRDLNRGRPGESQRSMFAQTGAIVTTIALHQCAWILKRLRDSSTSLSLTFDWTSNWKTPQSLFLWEAFVSGKAHSDSHEKDAATAAMYFYSIIDNLDDFNDIPDCPNPLSLIATCALWSGWVSELESLHKPCLVLRPSVPYSGTIKSINPALSAQ